MLVYNLISGRSWALLHTASRGHRQVETSRFSVVSKISLGTDIRRGERGSSMKIEVPDKIQDAHMNSE